MSNIKISNIKSDNDVVNDKTTTQTKSATVADLQLPADFKTKKLRRAPFLKDPRSLREAAAKLTNLTSEMERTMEDFVYKG
jgi:hypothetical protein